MGMYWVPSSVRTNDDGLFLSFSFQTLRSETDYLTVVSEFLALSSE